MPPGQPLLPVDVVFYGTEQHVHHVGLYIGDGLMIDVPDIGQMPIPRARDSGDVEPVGVGERAWSRLAE